MQSFHAIQDATEVTALVAFFDLTSFARYARQLEPAVLFATMDAYYELAGDVLENAGGRIVKFIGDAGLVVFDEEHVDAGVVALLELKERGDAWWADHDARCRHVIKAHYGPVQCGYLGTRSDKRFDVFGATVNTTAMLNSNGIALSAQAFRRLRSETRKHFKKHTPPITYIPVTAPHRD